MISVNVKRDESGSCSNGLCKASLTFALLHVGGDGDRKHSEAHDYSESDHCYVWLGLVNGGVPVTLGSPRDLLNTLHDMTLSVKSTLCV